LTLTRADVWEIIGLIGALLGVLWITVRSLIVFSYAQKTKVDSLKNNFVAMQIAKLEGVTDNFAKKIESVVIEITKLQENAKGNQEGQQRVFKALTDFVNKTDTKFMKLENEIQSLGREIFVVKGMKTCERNFSTPLVWYKHKT
jgi:dynactin complex subunit